MIDNPPQLYLLPGFHGSPQLFGPLLTAFGETLNTHPLGFQSCDTLTEHANKLSSVLPAEGCFLLAESFSGLIALKLSAEDPARFKGIILSASFAQSPFLALCRIGSHLPVNFYRPNPARKFILKKFCLNGVHDIALENQILDAVNEVSPSAVKKRLSVLAKSNLTDVLPKITTPTLILEASEDRVVSKTLIKELLMRLPNVQHQEIVGPHLILQTQPSEAAKAITNFVTAI